jgi:hypothetical protein
MPSYAPGHFCQQWHRDTRMFPAGSHSNIPRNGFVTLPAYFEADVHTEQGKKMNEFELYLKVTLVLNSSILKSKC